MIKIEINCTPEDLDGHIAALGFMRNPVIALGLKKPTVSELEALLRADNGPAVHINPDGTVVVAGAKTSQQSVVDIVESMRVDPGPSAFATEMEAHERPSDLAALPQDPSAKRIPGQPAPGRKRRTKEEMEEDYAYLKRHKLTDFPSAGAAISTGEARIDPEAHLPDSVASSAAAAQDEADEAAETAMRATDKPTMEDLRRAVAKWTEKVGSAAAIKDLRSIIGCAMIELPEAEIGAAITRVEAAIGGSVVLGVPNLNGQPPALEEAEIIETPKSTKEEVISAIMAYGKLYDGSVDPNVMPVTKEDLPKIFGRLFGNGVTGIGSMPAKSPEAFGQIFAAISAATRDNPFRREARV